MFDVSFLLELVYTYGYLGIFVVSVVTSMVVLLPTPHSLIIIGAGAVLNPFLVGIVAAIGSTIGEFTAYIVGYGGRKISIKEKRNLKSWYNRIERWFQRHGGFLIVFIFTATPLPYDVIGLFCGLINYDTKKFLLATLLGKIVANLLLAYVGYFGINLAIQYL